MMFYGTDPGGLLLTVAILVLVFLAADLFLAGGGMTGGMMGGMAGMMGTPWGWSLLLLLVVVLALLFSGPRVLGGGWPS